MADFAEIARKVPQNPACLTDMGDDGGASVALSELLRRLLAEHGVSQATLAKVAGVDRETVRNLLRGTRRANAATVSRLDDAAVSLSLCRPGELRAVSLGVAIDQDADVFSGRGARLYDEYTRAVEDSTGGFDLLGCGFQQVREDYASLIDHKSREHPLRMLLLDPDAGFADVRDKEERVRLGTIRSSVEAWLDHAHRSYTSEHQVTIRLYRAMPAVQITRIGGTMFWGPYLVGNVSRNMFTRRAVVGSIEFTDLQRHFDELWSDEWSSETFTTRHGAAGRGC